jgi:hypothetical protein
VASSVSVTQDTTFNSIVVQSGGTLTATGLVSVLTNMTVQSGGVVTHAVRDTAGLRLDVAGTLDVQVGGAIDATAKGLLGGTGIVAGETFGANDAIVAGAGGGANYGAGASYGGPGANSSDATTNAQYGRVEDARHLGSGGGGSTGTPGGAGGGRVRIHAAALVLNGAIRADGGPGVHVNGTSGAGSGGSIALDLGAVSGSGSLAANGGAGANGWSWAAAGGGGRIVIRYATDAGASGLQIATTGGANNDPPNHPTLQGGAGTGYYKDAAAAVGDVEVNNAGRVSVTPTRLLTGLSTLGQIRVHDQGSLALTDVDVPVLTLQRGVLMWSTGSLDVENGVSLTIPSGQRIDVGALSTATLETGSVLNGNNVRVGGGTLNSHIDLPLAGTGALELSN